MVWGSAVLVLALGVSAWSKEGRKSSATLSCAGSSTVKVEGSGLATDDTLLLVPAAFPAVADPECNFADPEPSAGANFRLVIYDKSAVRCSIPAFFARLAAHTTVSKVVFLLTVTPSEQNDRSDSSWNALGISSEAKTKLIPRSVHILTTVEAHGLASKSNDTTCTYSAKEPADDALRSFSKTSVLFVSVSFIILMVISLAWLVFYYVQRFRYAHAKDRLARRLFNAAKKALTKIPTRAIRNADKELDTDCPVCIEPYRHGDIIRTLPCKHVFHKTCVDPWLLEHRTCPMCKSDILKAFGYSDSVRAAEEGMDGVSAGGASSDGAGSSSGAGYAAYPYPVTDSDIHDPFFPSPAPSPSLVQQVVHSGNASGFSIIPLTVHSSGSVSRPGLVGMTTSLSSSNPALPPLGPRSSDSSAELPSPLGESGTVAGVEVHHPLGSTSASDSHGHSASCESSSDSDSSLSGLTAAPSHRPPASVSSTPSTPLSTSTEPLFRPRPIRSPSLLTGSSAVTPTPLDWATVSSASSAATTAVVISPSRRRGSGPASSGRSRASGRLRRGLSSASSEAASSRRFEPKRNRNADAVAETRRASRVGSLESL